jgi:hypothetical protein
MYVKTLTCSKGRTFHFLTLAFQVANPIPGASMSSFCRRTLQSTTCTKWDSRKDLHLSRTLPNFRDLAQPGKKYQIKQQRPIYDVS